MNVKRYIVKDMQEAMDRIRKELGSDAIVLSSKAIRKKGVSGFFSPKLLEVMVAYDPPQKPLTRTVPQPVSYPSANPQQFVPAPLPVPEPKTQENPAAQFAAIIAEQQGVPAIPLPKAAAQYQQNRGAVQYQQNRPASQYQQQGSVVPIKPPEIKLAEVRPPDDQIKTKLEDITTLIAGLSERVSGITREGQNFSGEFAVLYSRLLDSEVQEDIARMMVEQTVKLSQKGGEPKEILRELIAQSIGEPAPLKVKPFRRSVVLMLGPTGVGKTTSLIKLAVYYQVKQDLKVGLINTDTFRVAASEQLKIYSEILGTQMSVVYSPDEIADVLKEHDDKDMVFIDTAGKRPSDEKHKREIEQYIKEGGIEDVFLVISGSTGFKAVKSIIDNYSFIKDYKLIVTKMDEAATSGIILNACGMAMRPLSYIAAGQNIPNDIEVADPEKIALEILGG